MGLTCRHSFLQLPPVGRPFSHYINISSPVLHFCLSLFHCQLSINVCLMCTRIITINIYHETFLFRYVLLFMALHNIFFFYIIGWLEFLKINVFFSYWFFFFLNGQKLFLIYIRIFFFFGSKTSCGELKMMVEIDIRSD